MAIETPSCCDTQYDLLRKILLSLPSITETGTNICGFTPNSVIFAGPTGCLTEDPTDFYFDSSNNALTIGDTRIFNNSFEDVFVGDLAGNFANTGTKNTGLGYRALASIVTSDRNTGIGASALFKLTSGGRNTAVGAQAMFSNLTGEDNAAVGSTSLFENTSGSSNSAFGVNALRENLTGDSNTAIGRSAMLENTSGSSNTAVGRSAMLENLTGEFNVALGNFALDENLSGSNNVAVGRLAGVTAVAANANTTGSNNTFIGYQSGPGSVTQRTNATALGYQALVDADNSLVLGGIGANSVSVGIGVTAPNSRLQVSGAIATPISTKIAAYPVVITDGTILVNAVAAPVTITLPTPVGIAGRRYTVKKIDASANAVTIATAAGTIDGAATKVTIVQYVSYDFVSDGANWFIV